ncbi:carbohydrate-binding module family 1 protein [Pterulicium gracile]|uniref:Carbohydrate-binding module family 1 protein n=1 Tax=Pterulicium gracile TaxID=1884261 RepID=A0A5C3QRR6_9AGAR|nr:carbohydrate-binding module family 1 protein [Pterula gracilis]
MVFLSKLVASLVAVSVASVKAGTILWDGSFTAYPNSSTFDQWSWGNQVGQYQWYIHGSQPTSRYLAVDSSYKNPAATKEARGLKMTIDSSALWNGQTMARTELIPQTKANLGTGTQYYHFSMMRSNTNPPNFQTEHQINFFESHALEFKIGVGGTTNLQWFAGGSSRWSTPWTAGTWYNFAYEINFSSNTAALWASTGGAALTKVTSNISVTVSTNSADWHLGVLRVQGSGVTSDFYFSGVYIESGSITTAIGSGVTTPEPTQPEPTSQEPTQEPTPTSTATGPAQTQWGQCGGIGYTGPVACAGSFKCVKLNDFYSQCQ